MKDLISRRHIVGTSATAGVRLSILATVQTRIRSLMKHRGKVASSSLFFAACSSIYPATYYVAPAEMGGSDSNPGTISAPLLTLEQASWKAGGGDTIWVRGGTYLPTHAEYIHGRGTASTGSVAVRAYPGETPVFDGSAQPGAAGPGSKGTDTVTVDGAYVTVTGLEVRNSSGTGLALWAAHDILIHGNLVHNSQYQGIWVGGNTLSITIDGNRIEDNGLINAPRTMNGGWPSGISLDHVSNITVTGNLVRRNYGEGIGMVSSENVKVSTNSVLDNFSAGIYCDNCGSVEIDRNFVATSDPAYYRKGYPSTCIEVANEVNTQVKLTDIAITNGVYINCGHAFEYGKWQGIQGGGVRRLRFLNNTVWHSSLAMVKVDPDQNQFGNEFANNVFFQAGSAPLSMITAAEASNAFQFHHNAWFGGSAGSASGPNDVNADPQLVHPGTFDARDYRLRSDSRLVRAGADLATVSVDFDGMPRSTPYSIGAFAMSNLLQNAEFESGSPFPWQPYGSAELTGTGARSGRYAAAITTAGGLEGGLEQLVSGLKPSTTYTLRAYVRTSNPSETVFLGSKHAGPAQESIAVSSVTYVLATHHFTTGPVNTSATVYFYKPSGTNPAYADDFELIEGSY